MTRSPPATLYPALQTQLANDTARNSRSVDLDLPTPTAIGQHQVVWGDTLSGIAASYGTTLSALMAMNELSNPDLLAIGQIIKLPPPPQSNSPNIRTLSNKRLVRAGGANGFDVDGFVSSQPGLLSAIGDMVDTRRADGVAISEFLTSGQIVERVSLEYSVDPRILLSILDYKAGLLSRNDPELAEQIFPLLSLFDSEDQDHTGLYALLSWLADRLNQGFYGWKYRNKKIVELSGGARFWYHPDLNAASVAVQYIMSLLSDEASWKSDIGEQGLIMVYRKYFGDPFADAADLVPTDLGQPDLTLPFPPGDVWLFTGGFHGGWGNGSAWAAVDFAPPLEQDIQHFCYTSSFPLVAVADGTIARLGAGVVVLDLDRDDNEGTGWTILYLHVTRVDSLQEGQQIEAGQLLGYASCQGGFSTATHLHIARRYNGEWLPADCSHCPENARVAPFVMSNWQVVGLENQLYQGYLYNQVDNRSVVAEQAGRTQSMKYHGETITVGFHRVARIVRINCVAIVIICFAGQFHRAEAQVQRTATPIVVSLVTPTPVGNPQFAPTVTVTNTATPQGPALLQLVNRPAGSMCAWNRIPTAICWVPSIMGHSIR